MWNVLDRFAENVRIYSTPIGQLWNTVNFVFRLFVIVAVGSSVYGDEQGAFKCDTGQPGCQNVCFNRFSPISHMRFWAFQILFVSTPPIFFYLYAGMQTGRVKKLEQKKKELKKNKDEMEEARQELLNAAEEQDDGKSQAAFSTFDEKNTKVKEEEIRVKKLEKKVGRYKEKQVNEFSKGGTLTQVIFTTKVRIVYIIHCIIKFGIECLFLYLGYILQHQQSRVWGLQTWTVPEKYTCTHALIYGAAGSACAQQEKVTCWVSRPWEKQYFLYYMLSMTAISMLLIIGEAFYMIFHVTKKGIQRRAAVTAQRHNLNQSAMFYDASNFQDNMMTMRSGKHLRNGFSAANSWRYATLKSQMGNRSQMAPPYHQYMNDPKAYQYAGPPIIDDFLPDEYNRNSRGGSRRGQFNPVMSPMNPLSAHNNNIPNMPNLPEERSGKDSVDGELVAIKSNGESSHSNKENQKVKELA